MNAGRREGAGQGGTKVQRNMLDQRCKAYYIHMSLVTVSHPGPHFGQTECVDCFKDSLGKAIDDVLCIKVFSCIS